MYLKSPDGKFLYNFLNKIYIERNTTTNIILWIYNIKYY